MKGGVEEQKEEMIVSSPSFRNRNSKSSEEADKAEVGDENGFRAQVEEFAKTVFGSCGSVIEAASFFVQERGCRWDTQQTSSPVKEKPPLSIADELRKMAARGENPQPIYGQRPADIPKFLGEDAVYSFDDDNISAISQHTLEEMARRGFVHPFHRQRSAASNQTPPSPTRTRSLSTSSSKERRKMEALRAEV